MRSIADCFRVLGLPATASAREVTAAYRRLAKQLHPDRNPTVAAQRRFVEIADAYAILRDALRAREVESRWGRCPCCGKYADLYDGVGGRVGCANCLLGRTRLSRYLPLPVIVVARHVAVFALYAAGVLLLLAYVRDGGPAHAVASLACVLAGLLVLAIEVLRIAWPEQAVARQRRGRYHKSSNPC